MDKISKLFKDKLTETKLISEDSWDLLNFIEYYLKQQMNVDLSRWKNVAGECKALAEIIESGSTLKLYYLNNMISEYKDLAEDIKSKRSLEPDYLKDIASKYKAIAKIIESFDLGYILELEDGRRGQLRCIEMVGEVLECHVTLR